MSYKFESNGIVVEFDDNSPEVLKALENAVNRGLKACGEKAVGYAQNELKRQLKHTHSENDYVATGNLMGSITYEVDGDDCYIGTNVEYAPYVEMGTGKFAESGGRQTPWVYKDDQGHWHRTEGQKPKPFLKPSAENHSEEYREILKDSLENA